MNAGIVALIVTPEPTLPVILDKAIDSRVETIILATYASGTVPETILPQIRKATKALIPVFAIRQTRTDKWFTEWSDYKEEVVPGTYDAEVQAIAAGMIPLQKDLLREKEVLQIVKEVCGTHTDYELRVRHTRDRCSSPAFNNALDIVREKYC